MSAAAHTGSKGSCRDPQLTRRLLIRPGAIGDTIVSLPALEFCRADYTEVWSSVPLVAIADRVRSIVSTGLELLELGLDDRARREMQSFDSILSWYGTNRPEFRNCVADLPVAFFPALPADAQCHAVDFYMRQVGGPDGLAPRIDTGIVARRDFVAIHPFSGSPRKNWPLNGFQDVAIRLPLPAEFAAGPDECLDEAQRFDDLWDLARWLASARLYIGNDSGVTHLAAAVGTPVIAIFRASDPRVWSPRGRTTVLVLEGDVAVGDVLRAAGSLLRSA